MRRDTFLLWLLVAVLLLAMALTLIFAPARGRHGYGFLDRPKLPSPACPAPVIEEGAFLPHG